MSNAGSENASRGSAFSRFASFSTGGTSNHSASSSTGSIAPPSSAQDVLEQLASVHLGRARHPSEERGAASSADELPPSPRPAPRPYTSASGSHGGSSSYWGSEVLPQNASAFSSGGGPGSAFTDGSHFFPPGSSFSFEGDPASYSPSRGVSGSTGFRGARLIPPDGFEQQSPWDAYSSSARRASFPVTKTRSMKLVLNGDKGIVGLAKPKDSPDGTVVVAGKSFLRLLKVPPRDRLPPLERPSTSVNTSSSIASRRSRSRGSPVPLDRNRKSTSAERPVDEIVEVLDLKAGSKLGAGYLFSHVRWGYGDLMHQHDRAVNQVLFGGPTGNYLLSAGQDGNIKLWDVRGNRTSNNVLKASSPVQRIAFSPSASQPWTLLAVCASGTMIRYDLRNLSSGKPGGAMTDRIAGHVGACLAMDWRDSYGSDGADRRDGGWVVTGGMDRTIKVWDFSQPILQNRPVRTLYSSQPVQDVAWHPTRGTEIASSPMPTLGTLLRGGVEETSGGSSASLDTTKERTTTRAFWKNEIEIWDTRRAYFPKLAIKTDEPISAILYNDDETIWATSKSTPTFHQYDIANDSTALLDSVPRLGSIWNAQGDLWFSGAGSGNDSPWAAGVTSSVSEEPSIESPNFRPDVSLACVSDFDFDREAFALFAEGLLLNGDDFAQLWSTIKIWLDDKSSQFPESPPDTPPPPPPKGAPVTPPTFDLGEWLSSPHSVGPDLRLASKTPARRSFSNPLARDGHSRSRASPIILPSDPIKSNLDAFAEESSESSLRSKGQHFSPLPPAIQPASPDPTSSDSEQDRTARLRAIASSTGGTPGTNKLVANLASLQTSRNRSATLSGLGHFTPLDSQSGAEKSDDDDDDDDDADDLVLPPAPRATSKSRLQSRIPSSSSGSDSDAQGSHAAKARAAKKMARSGVIHRRASSGASADRRPRMSRDGTLQYGLSRHPSVDRRAASMTRRGSTGLTSTSLGPAAPPSRPIVPGPTPTELAREEGLAHFKEATSIVKAQLRATLQEYADKLCATVCCVLRNKDIGFDTLFVSRVTKAYLDLLRRCNLYTSAASLIKYCASPAISALSQTNVDFHTACGKCGKALDQAPSFGFCRRCKNHQPTRCCICHLIVRSLIVMCASCGHGAHPGCLTAYTAKLSDLAAISDHSHAASADGSHPSTPGFAMPGTRMWMWGEMEDLEDENDSRRESLRELLNMCPEGSCGHHRCLIMDDV
ncbi:hypothetical protein RQP46_004948 [Phenoliferia psychrophenolica]